MKKLLPLLCLCLINFTCLAQDDAAPEDIEKMKQSLLQYRKIFDFTDTAKFKPPGVLSSDLYSVADSLNKLNPVEFFNQSMKLFEKSKYNDAAFLFYVGRLRFAYYNKLDPNYQEGDSGALSAALGATVGEPINMYLHCNAENFASILEQSANWVKSNDYELVSRSKDPDGYAKILGTLLDIAKDIEKNEKKYQSLWAYEQKEFKQQIDLSLKEIDSLQKKSSHQ